MKIIIFDKQDFCTYIDNTELTHTEHQGAATLTVNSMQVMYNIHKYKSK